MAAGPGGGGAGGMAGGGMVSCTRETYQGNTLQLHMGGKSRSGSSAGSGDKAVVPARARHGWHLAIQRGKIRLRLIYLAIQPRQTVRRRLFRSRHLPRWLPVWVRVAAPAAASMGVWDSFPDSRASGGWEERISPAVSAAAFSAISTARIAFAFPDPADSTDLKTPPAAPSAIATSGTAGFRGHSWKFHGTFGRERFDGGHGRYGRDLYNFDWHGESESRSLRRGIGRQTDHHRGRG